MSFTFKQNQTTDVMINNYTGTNAASFDVVVSDQYGVAVDAAGDKLLFKQLLADGTYRPSEIIDPKMVKYVSKTVSVTAVAKAAAFTLVPGGVGTRHEVVITINEWGSKSFEDQDFTPAWVIEETGDTAITLAEKMIEILAANFKNYQPSTGKKETIANVTNSIWINPILSFAHDGAGLITLTEKTQRYVQGHIDPEFVDFYAKAGSYASGSETFVAVTVAYTDRVVNPLDAKLVNTLEWNVMGNYGDLYDGAGYPHNFKREYISDVSGTYVASYLIQYAAKGDGVEHGTESNRTLHIFCQSDSTDASGENAEAIEEAIETALGITLGAGNTLVEVNY